MNLTKGSESQGPRNKRLYIAVDEETFSVISNISKIANQPKSSVLSSLLFEMLPYFRLLEDQFKEASENRKRGLNKAAFVLKELQGKFDTLNQEVDQKIKEFSDKTQ